MAPIFFVNCSLKKNRLGISLPITHISFATLIVLLSSDSPYKYNQVSLVNGGEYQSRTDDQSFADSCLTTWLCRRNAVISISDIDYIKYGLICQALFKNYSKIFYELKKRVYLFISLPIFLSAIEIVPSLLLINSIYLSSSKYSTGTVISMPVSVFIF